MNVLSELLGVKIGTGKLSELADFLASEFPSGKYLVLTDEENAFAVTEALRRVQKKIMVVLSRTEDLLPLFSASDGVSCAVGVGRAVAAARYFACARGIPCVGVPLTAFPQGLGGKLVEVKAGGKTVGFPVPAPTAVFVDARRMQESGEGRFAARGFLAACATDLFGLAACEKIGLRATDGGREKKAYRTGSGEKLSEETRSLLSAAAETAFDGGATASELFSAALLAERCLSENAPEGEAVALAGFARPHGFAETPFFAAALALTEVYGLFFRDGYCRARGTDYNARFLRASALAKEFGESSGRFGELSMFPPPDAKKLEEYARTFEREKESLSAEVARLREKFKGIVGEGMRSDGRGAAERARIGGILGVLPELVAPRYTLTSLMRDFGML